MRVGRTFWTWWIRAYHCFQFDIKKTQTAYRYKFLLSTIYVSKDMARFDGSVITLVFVQLHQVAVSSVVSFLRQSGCYVLPVFTVSQLYLLSAFIWYTISILMIKWNNYKQNQVQSPLTIDVEYFWKLCSLDIVQVQCTCMCFVT